MKNLLAILGILILCFELYRLLRGNWIRRFLKKRKGSAQPRKPLVMKPKSVRDCPFCVKENGRQGSPKPEMPSAWRLRKGRGGPTKKISTQDHSCPNSDCEYFGITDESIHALVGYGSHGKQEPIQDLKCQACGKKFTSRKNTILYRLKTHFGLVEKIMWLLALGVDASALEEVFSVREITLRTWLFRSGLQGKKLHERFMLEMDLIHVQLDELWANVGRCDPLKRLIVLCTLAKRYEVKVILSSWYYLHTFWQTDEAINAELLGLLAQERFLYFARALDYILCELEQRGLQDTIAFAEIFNEADGLDFVGFYGDMTQPKEELNLWRSWHDDALEFLKVRHPGIRFALDTYTPWINPEHVPRNMQVWNFHLVTRPLQ